MSIYQDHSYKHGVGWSTWHFQWCTKYRYRVFADSKLQKLCGIFLHEIAKKHNFAIEEFEVDVDHVHVIASLRTSMSPAKAVQLMKGYTARMLFLAEEQRLKSFYWRASGKRSLWSSGKFIASVGHITLEKAKDYVKNHVAYDAKDILDWNPRPLGLGRMSNSLSDSVQFASIWLK